MNPSPTRRRPTRFARATVLLAAAAVLWGALPVQGQDEPSSKASDFDALHAFHQQEFARYDFRVESDPPRKLKLVTTPVMVWQGDGDWFGDVFIWTYKDKPHLIGCIGTWAMGQGVRGVFHEFHSLAEQPLAAVRIGNNHTWAPDQGITWTAVPDAQAPADGAGARAIQMRHIARGLTVQMQADSGEHQLRLLPKPLHRYAAEELDVVDGALFSFVWTNGTDPEFLLLVECRREAAGNRWYYAPARFTYRVVTVTRDVEEVWSLPRHEETYQASQLKLPYATVRVDDVTDAQLRVLRDPQ